MPLPQVHSTAIKSKSKTSAFVTKPKSKPPQPTTTPTSDMNQQLEESLTDFSTNQILAAINDNSSLNCVSSTPKATLTHDAKFTSSETQCTARRVLSLPLKSTNNPANAEASSTSSAHHLPRSKQSWLLRLFESKLFDMSLAITYLFNSKEQGVQVYIGKFTFLSAETASTQY